MNAITPNGFNRYYVLTDFGDGEIGHGCDLTDFDGACDAYSEHMDNGLRSTVFRVEASGDNALMSVDVTADANARIKTRCDASRSFEAYPEWLDGGESARQAAIWAAEDAAHIRQERHGGEQV